MAEYNNAVVFLTIVGLRVIVPLFIFRYPLPAIVASLLIDAADETLFRQFTDLSLENYQSYDKALDVYYLAIAYISTMRNWPHLFAVRVSTFLWYYRLVGSTLFELTGFRALLLLFPNVFEYFFIAFESVRARWDVRRLTRRHLLLTAAVIWIFIKLPQEYWVHVAQLDFTDFLKETVLGAAEDASWFEVLRDNLWLIPVTLLLAVIAWLIYPRFVALLPAYDYKPVYNADVNADEFAQLTPGSSAARHWRHGLLEKFSLVTMVSVIFAWMIPNVVVTTMQLVVGIAVVVAANAFISHLLATRGTEWRAVGTQFIAMSVINIAIGLAYVFFLPAFDGSVGWRDLFFFTFLLTLLVTLYDRYRPIYDLRVEHEERSRQETSGGVASG